MVTKKKGYGNPILNACSTSIKKERTISNQKSALYGIIRKAKEKIEKLDSQERNHHKVLCKELADEILSRDLRLDDTDLAFLTMSIGNKKFSKGPALSLLESLISRNRYRFYPPKDKNQVLSLAKVQKVIGYIDERVFIKNLNKKFEGIAKFKLKRLIYSERYLETLKSPPTDKIAFEIEFICKYSRLS